MILLEVIEPNNILLLFLGSSEFLAEALTEGKVRGRGGGEVESRGQLWKKGKWDLGRRFINK